jgi:RHS repeat-associated protein
MVGKTQGSYAATYSYRFGDKLKAATSSFPGETASVGYNYDGLGRRRLEQRDNTTATWFRWSGLEECGEYAGTVGSWTIGALQTGYVPGLATFAGSNPSTAEWRYHLTDHLGSVRQLSGQTKAALARYDYAPYGELMRNAGLPLTVGYTGHLWDSAIGQYYAPFRYYNPQTARWNMRDPLGFVDGPNVYAYVAGNPVNYVDSLGLCPGVIAFGGFLIVIVGALVIAKINVDLGIGAILIGAAVVAAGLLDAWSNFNSGVEKGKKDLKPPKGTSESAEEWLKKKDEEYRQQVDPDLPEEGEATQSDPTKPCPNPISQK